MRCGLVAVLCQRLDDRVSVCLWFAGMSVTRSCLWFAGMRVTRSCLWFAGMRVTRSRHNGCLWFAGMRVTRSRHNGCLWFAGMRVTRSRHPITSKHGKTRALQVASTTLKLFA